MMLFLILFSAVWVYYSLYSLRGFYIKIHQQVYQDYSEIISESLSFNDFIKKSSLMSFEFVTYQIFLSYLIILLPIYFVFEFDLLVVINYAVVLILLHLSWLDYAYYLTDIRMVAWVFILGIIRIVIENSPFSTVSLYTFLFALFFLYAISWLVSQMCGKSCLGSGDVLLLSSLALFFDMNDYLLLLFFSSFSGLLFILIYRLIQKIVIKIPFIPFVSLSFYTLFLYNYLNF